MTILSRTPVYNLNAVLKETGLHADVLRVWERRYELPKPQRTSGGHRLYSEYDVAIVKWLRARQTEGLRISRAVKLWKNITQTGKDPLSDYAPISPSHAQVGLDENSRVEILRNNWLNACLAFDSLKAEEVVNQAFAMYPVETVCFEILQKGLNEIGRLWFQGKALAQQEHFASALAIRRIETLITATPNPTREQTILTGCPSGEWHTFPVLMLCLLLRRNGLHVIYLGANIPLEMMEETTLSIHPDLIILASQQLRTAGAMKDAAILFQKLGIPLAYGGQVYNNNPELREKIPAYFLGVKLELAVGEIEQLLSAPEAYPECTQEENIYQEALAVYQSKLPLIEARLIDRFKRDGLPSDYLVEVNAFFAAGITAALKLGNPDFVEIDLEWVMRLLTDRNIPGDSLSLYLDAYREIVDDELGQDGACISEWIVEYIANHMAAKR